MATEEQVDNTSLDLNENDEILADDELCTAFYQFPSISVRLICNDRRGLVGGVCGPTIRWKDISRELPSHKDFPDEAPKPSPAGGLQIVQIRRSTSFFPITDARPSVWGRATTQSSVNHKHVNHQ